ncbi:MAG: hypothetical protein RMH97_01255 [Verrucomicrobiales bacterium]|nr:hypothetical protein [Verrucomicrobiales bacterium]
MIIIDQPYPPGKNLGEKQPSSLPNDIGLAEFAPQTYTPKHYLAGAVGATRFIAAEQQGFKVRSNIVSCCN